MAHVHGCLGPWAFRVHGVGMFTLILTVPNGDCNWGGGGGTRLPIKDCSYKGEHPKFRVKAAPI